MLVSNRLCESRKLLRMSVRIVALTIHVHIGQSRLSWARPNSPICSGLHFRPTSFRLSTFQPPRRWSNSTVKLESREPFSWWLRRMRPSTLSNLMTLETLPLISCPKKTALCKTRQICSKWPRGHYREADCGRIEQHIGTQVEKVSYKDMSFVDFLYEHLHAPNQWKNIILSIKHVQKTAWEGEYSASTTSGNALELPPPNRTHAEVLKALLKE